MDQIATSAQIPTATQAQAAGRELQQGKGKSKAIETAPVLGPPSMPVLAAMDPPWLATPQSSGAVASPPAGSQMDAKDQKEDLAKEKQLRSLVSALKKHNDQLPQELQSLIQNVNLRSDANETKILHSAVAAHGRAKRELAEAHQARSSLHTAWRRFLSVGRSVAKVFRDVFAAGKRACLGTSKPVAVS